MAAFSTTLRRGLPRRPGGERWPRAGDAAVLSRDAERAGAIQDRAGMRTATTIVAITKDAGAPIFEIADFGVVGDVFTVVPQLISTLDAKKR